MNESDNGKCEKEGMDVLHGILPGDVAYRICRRRKASLRRSLGLPGIFSIAYGNLGSTVYFALGVVALHALGATPFVILLSAVFFLFTAMAYAEGTAAIPEAGGSSSFARKGFNELVSFIAAWCLLLGYIAATGVAAFSAVNYLGYLEDFEVLRTAPWNMVAVGILLFVLMLINIMGIKESSVLSIIFAIIDVTTQIFIVIVGSLFFLNIPKLWNSIHWGVAPSWTDLATAAFLVMISFTGIETVSNLAEESKSPEKTIPQSMWLSVGIIIILFLGLANVAMGAMPVTYQVKGYVYSIETTPGAEKSGKDGFIVYYKTTDKNKKGKPIANALIRVDRNIVRTNSNGYFILKNIPRGAHELLIKHTGYDPKGIEFNTSSKGEGPVQGKWTTELTEKWINAPLSGIVSKMPVFRKTLGVWVPILAFTILVIATNAGILGFSRVVFSMSNHRQVPPLLGALHSGSRTPWLAIVIFTVAAYLIILPGKIEKMAEVYAFAAMISYTIAHVSIIALRIKRPDLERPYKIPLNIKISKYEIPITSVIGSLVCFALWLAVAVKLEFGRNVGVPFIAIGVLMYILYRTRSGYSLTETVEYTKRM